MARLSNRDREIVADTVRCHIMTNEILHEHRFPNQRANAVTRVTARLCREEWLSGFPLNYPRKYFVPGKRAVKHHGIDESRSFPLGPQSLPTEYACLEYVFNLQIRRTRITTEEIRRRLPWYAGEWCTSPHCLSVSDDMAILELLRVDLGGPADHVARKCRVDIERRCEQTEFRRFLQEETFRLVVITATTDKAAAIQQSLDRHLWPSELKMHIAVIPALLPLMPGSP